MTKIEIIDCTTVHGAVIGELQRRCFVGGDAGEGSTIADLAAKPAAFGHLALAAQNSSGAPPPDPVGYILGLAAGGECEILSLSVVPAYRRRGIAGALLVRFIEVARDRGGGAIYLEVGAANAPALALYAAHGFSQAGRRAGYYRRPDGAEDALILKRGP